MCLGHGTKVHVALFFEYFGFFLRDRVGMSCLIGLYELQKGKLHACNVRQRRIRKWKVHVIRLGNERNEKRDGA